MIACALLGFIWIIAAFAIYGLVTGNPTFLDVVGPSGANKLGTPLGLSIWIAIGSILCIGVMIVCAYLRGVFETLVAGDPFVPENATRFTAIAIVLAVMETSAMFVAAIVSLVFGVLAPSGPPVAFQFPNIKSKIYILQNN